MVGTCGPKSSSAVTMTALLTDIVKGSEAGLVTGGAGSPPDAIMVSGVPAAAGVIAGRGALELLSPCCRRKRMPTMKASATNKIIGKAHGDCLRSGSGLLLFFLLIKSMIRVQIFWPRIHADQNVDRKSTRLNSSHTVISYAVFCLK